MKLLTTFAFIAMTSMSLLFGQSISAAGSLGWSIPGGSGVSDAPEDLNLGGGLGYNIDVLYHLSEQIGVGIGYSSSILAGKSEGEGFSGDIDIFGTRVIGAKGLWRMKAEGFSPFAGLTLGLSQLLTPEVTITDGSGNTTVIEEQTGSGFGIQPEVGISFGGVFLSANYLVPVSYTVEDVVADKALGSLNINIGYRRNFDF